MTRIDKEKLMFPNQDGAELAAALESATAEPSAYALFAHCFTCSKDIAAASRISRALAERGFGVLRFDFTGLGNSEGDFANTNFSSNVDDLVRAADFLRETRAAPSLLIGHSLGGAAVLASARAIPEAKAVATIGAPASPEHVAHLFGSSRAEIEAEGCAVVNLAGREFRIKKQFLDDISQQNLHDNIKQMGKALLVMHAPRDDTVPIDEAGKIFEAALHPKSFISLDDADHLLSRRADSEYVAQTIAAWASRYVSQTDLPDAGEARPQVDRGKVLVTEKDHKFTQDVFTDAHHLLADEPQRFGGANAGPSPYEFLLTALGACTAMTVRMYANRKKLPLDNVSVMLAHNKIHAQDCEHCETQDGKIDRIERELVLEGALTPEQRQRMLEIADKCPVHRTLHSEIDVQTRLA